MSGTADDGEREDAGYSRTLPGLNNSHSDHAESGNSIASAQASISSRHHDETRPYGRSTATATTGITNINADGNALDPAPRQISDSRCQPTRVSEKAQTQSSSNTPLVSSTASLFTPTGTDSTAYTNPDSGASTNQMSSSSSSQSSSPTSYLTLIACPICGPTSLLISPTTLDCGHTVCASHILPRPHFVASPSTPPSSTPTLGSAHDQIHIQPPQSASTSAPDQYPSPTPGSLSNSTDSQAPPPTPSTSASSPTCPLRTCPFNVPSSHRHSRSPYQTMLSMYTTPQIPSTSRVAFFPAPLPTSSGPGPVYIPGKVDVTVSKVVTLVTRAAALGDGVGCGGEEGASADAGNVFGGDGKDSATEDKGKDEDETDLASRSPYPSISRPRPRPHDFSPSPSPPGSPKPGPSSTHRRPRKRARWTSSVDSDAESDSDLKFRANLNISKSKMKAKAKTSSQASEETSTEDSDRKSPQTQFERDLMVELTCEICFMLLYQPVTTPCQHTFCFRCLQRSLDHNTSCPLCRTDLIPQAYTSATNFSDTVFISQARPRAHAHTDHQPSPSQSQSETETETESEDKGYPAPNKLLLSILLKAFPSVYASKSSSRNADNIADEEIIKRRLDTPIFVCQLSFPGMPTLLHFFEPRYRLMLRRCLESSNPRFGMIMPSRVAPPSGSGQSGNGIAGNDFGTMLEIRRVQMLPDGRSVVETWGTHRFRLLDRDSLDGYMVGRIERIDDFDEELEDVTSVVEDKSSEVVVASGSTLERDPIVLTRHLPSPLRTSSFPHPSSPASRTNAELISICRAFLDQVRDGNTPWVVQRMNNAYGPMPAAEDLSAFSFWMALLLPIDEHDKAKLLPIRSARLRLRLVVHWIEQVSGNWWFSSGCIVL